MSAPKNSDFVCFANAILDLSVFSNQELNVWSKWYFYIFRISMFIIMNYQGHKLEMEQISNETFIWLSSLASSDPYGILPGLYFGIAMINLIVKFSKIY